MLDHHEKNNIYNFNNICYISTFFCYEYVLTSKWIEIYFNSKY